MASSEAVYRDDTVTATVTLVESGLYLLEWTDGINEWWESYDSAPVAYARFALLLSAAACDRLFAHGPDAFATYATAFLDDQLQVEPPRSRFRFNQPVRVVGTSETYDATFLREERNPDGQPNGVALVKVTSHSDRRVVGLELHVGISILEATG